MADFPYLGALAGIALDSSVRGPGVYTSASLKHPDADNGHFVMFLYVGDVTGTPELTCSFESSSDGGATWGTVPGTSIPALSAPGHASANVVVDPDNDVRVTSTVGGTGSPTVTYRVMVFAKSAF
jgi:hypothetical protein